MDNQEMWDSEDMQLRIRRISQAQSALLLCERKVADAKIALKAAQADLESARWRLDDAILAADPTGVKDPNTPLFNQG